MEADYRFLEQEDASKVAQQLLGMQLWVQHNHGSCAGIITETEAYSGIEDRASHAYLGKKTARNAIMFDAAGSLYVYCCYGIHHLFNIVTGPKDFPAAVLIRAVQPIAGFELMAAYAGSKARDQWCSGPGCLSRNMGIDLSFNRSHLTYGRVWLQDAERPVNEVVATPRIGVAFAGDDALLPRRFYLKGTKSVSKPLFPKYSLQI